MVYLVISWKERTGINKPSWFIFQVRQQDVDKEAWVLSHQNEETEEKKSKTNNQYLFNALPKPQTTFTLSLDLFAPEQYNATFFSSNGPSPGLFFFPYNWEDFIQCSNNLIPFGAETLYWEGVFKPCLPYGKNCVFHSLHYPAWRNLYDINQNENKVVHNLNMLTGQGDILP